MRLGWDLEWDLGWDLGSLRRLEGREGGKSQNYSTQSRENQQKTGILGGKMGMLGGKKEALAAARQGSRIPKRIPKDQIPKAIPSQQPGMGKMGKNGIWGWKDGKQ